MNNKEKDNSTSTSTVDKRITIYVMKEEMLGRLDDAFNLFTEARGAFKVSRSQFYSHLLIKGLETMERGN